MTEQSSNQPDTSLASSSSPSPPSFSAREFVRLVFGTTVAGLALWYLHAPGKCDEPVPWKWRLVGTVAIGVAAVLPAPTIQAIVIAVVNKLPFGGGSR